MTMQRLLSSNPLLILAISVGCSSESPNADTNMTTPMNNGGALGVAGTTGTAGTGVNPVGTAGTTTGGTAGVPASGGVGGQIDPQGGSGGASGGAGGTAGAGGSTGGTAGVSTGGTQGIGGRPSGPSSACGGPIAPDVLVEPVRHDMTVTVDPEFQPAYTSRYYYTNLPSTWDPAKPYPVMMYGAGCGQTGPEGGPFANMEDYLYVQLISASVTGDTVVPPSGAPGCFQAGREGMHNSPDGPYFDQVLAEVAAKYCIDLGQIYVAGWSSGAWLSNWLACARGGVIRSTVAGSGGLFEDHGTCLPGTAAMIFPGDAGSTQQNGFDIGAAYGRDQLIMANGCDTTPTTMAFGGANNCEYYGNCTLGAPVVYCTDGGGHGGPLGFMKDAGLALWATLP